MLQAELPPACRISTDMISGRSCVGLPRSTWCARKYSVRKAQHCESEPSLMNQCSGTASRRISREITRLQRKPPSGRQNSTSPASYGDQPCASCMKIGRILYEPVCVVCEPAPSRRHFIAVLSAKISENGRIGSGARRSTTISTGSRASAAMKKPRTTLLSQPRSLPRFSPMRPQPENAMKSSVPALSNAFIFAFRSPRVLTWWSSGSTQRLSSHIAAIGPMANRKTLQ